MRITESENEKLVFCHFCDAFLEFCSQLQSVANKLANLNFIKGEEKLSSLSQFVANKLANLNFIKKGKKLRISKENIKSVSAAHLLRFYF